MAGAGAVSIAMLSGRWPVMAGPFDGSDPEHTAPADKRLRAEWVRSLFERGEPTVYRGDELEKIGMPVGGIGAGQLYLGGDGWLWRWDIFNEVRGTNDSHFAHPPQRDFPVEQGFRLYVNAGGKRRRWNLDRTGFPDLSFCGEYPIGTVEYRDPSYPIAVILQAFSPFIPLNVEDSSLPATILCFTLKNTGEEAVDARLVGWLENAVCLNHRSAGGTRRNRVVREAGLTFLECSAAGPDLEQLPDYGSMGLALLGRQADLGASSVKSDRPDLSHPSESPLAEKLVGVLGQGVRLEPGKAASVVFVLTWRFPNLEVKGLGRVGRHYATRFDSALAVARFVAKNYRRLTRETRLWRDTWYRSSLPRWFLDRTLLTASVLATSTCYRFADGRFYAWEGVGCCAGTCTHVWHYAHAMARLFPELERDTRERVDLGIAMNPETGVMGFRAEFDRGLAVDGQAGTLLRVYREHQMSQEDAFLRRNWPRIRKAYEPLLALDGNDDGVLEGPQMNTLDQPWFGRIAWLSSLYVAALRAGEKMALEMGETAFADRCRTVADRGARNIDAQLFNGEYYVQLPDPTRPRTAGSYDGCEIDQVFGESWARQVGLAPLLPKEHVGSALASLWKYSFAPDVGPWRAAHKPGRWYALAGEAGLIMCTWPHGEGQRVQQGFDYYFNECMTGFEYQAAGHMVWEGMVQEGLAVVRAIHDRYHASRRNPWNEVECGDHYARSMASYGVYLAACGYEHHGPKGHLGFAPRLNPDRFRAAFTTAEGWGSYSQTITAGRLRAELALAYGRLRLTTLALNAPPNFNADRVQVELDDKDVPVSLAADGQRVTVSLAPPVTVSAGQKLRVTIG